MEKKNQIDVWQTKTPIPTLQLKCKYLPKDLKIILKISKCFCKHMQIEDEYASFNVGLLWNFLKKN